MKTNEKKNLCNIRKYFSLVVSTISTIVNIKQYHIGFHQMIFWPVDLVEKKVASSRPS